jgi:hypothetical protein
MFPAGPMHAALPIGQPFPRAFAATPCAGLDSLSRRLVVVVIIPRWISVRKAGGVLRRIETPLALGGLVANLIAGPRLGMAPHDCAMATLIVTLLRFEAGKPVRHAMRRVTWRTL